MFFSKIELKKLISFQSFWQKQTSKRYYQITSRVDHYYLHKT